MKVHNPIGVVTVAPGTGLERVSATPAPVIGILSNGKPNATELLTEVTGRLAANFSTRTAFFEYRRRPEDALLERVASESIAVLTGNGD